MLWQASEGSGFAACIVEVATGSDAPSPDSPNYSLVATEFATLDELTARVNALLPTFSEPTGVLLIVFSLIISRGGTHAVEMDMDEPSGGLVARFGWTTQELLNLLLTGRATSGAFDGVRSFPVSDGEAAEAQSISRLRGVASQPPIGYLSRMEALGHTNVGAFYKTPRAPVWVIGSDSHFSVLWAESRDVLSDPMGQRAWDAFARLDQGGGGFISHDAVAELLRALGLPDGAAAALAVQADTAELGVVTWHALWPHLEVLLLEGGGGRALSGATNHAATSLIVSNRFSASPIVTANGGFLFGNQLDSFFAAALAPQTPAPSLLSKAIAQLTRGLPSGEASELFIVAEDFVKSSAACELLLGHTSAASEPVSKRQRYAEAGLPFFDLSKIGNGPTTEVAATPQRTSSSNSDTRTFTLMHFNGLGSVLRPARVVALIVTQPTSGAFFSSTAASGGCNMGFFDAASMMATGNGIEDDTAMAIALSRQEAGVGPEDDSFEMTMAASLSVAPSGGVQQSTTANRGSADALQSILRTRWPGCSITFHGLPPLLD